MSTVLRFPTRRRRPVAPTPLFSAKVLVFPLIRRRTLVTRAVEVMSALSPPRAERYLLTQLEFEQEILQKQNVDQDAIDRVLIKLTDEVLALLWKDTKSKPGGVA